MPGQKITTHLWFDDNAEEAVAFYSAIFDDARVIRVSRYGKSGPGPEGTVMSMEFELAGQRFMAVNGGPHFTFTEAISLVVTCEDQAEIDDYWEKLSDGGAPQMCGWLKDRYGLSWQIVPKALHRLMDGSDPAAADRVMGALLQMVKLDIGQLEEAHKAG